MANTFKFKSLETTDAFTLRSLSDRTKAVTFSLSSLSSGQTRVLTVPNKSGTIALLDDITGVTTGSVDNAIIRADGTGGSTSQSSAITISDEIRTFSITGDAGTDIITATGSGFANGQRVRITALTGGSGLSTGNYFVINVSGDTFQVSTTEGGAASLFTTNITAGTLINGHFLSAHTQISNTGANTNIPLVLTPKGTGAFIVGNPPDGTTTGGNSRGSYAIDITTGAPRVAADRVGSGVNSVSIGREANARSESSIAVGYGAVCSEAPYSVAIGLNAATIANDAIAMGQSAAARSTNSIVIGKVAFVDYSFSNAIAIGASSVGGATSAIAIGASTSVTGVNAVGLNAGTSLRSAFACRPFAAVYWGGTTTTNAATILNLDGTATNRFTIAANTALAVDILLVARRSDTADKWLVARRFLGIRRDGSNNTSLIGTVQDYGLDQSAGSPSWTFALTADDTNDALQLEVTGATGETINWRATAIYRVVG